MEGEEGGEEERGEEVGEREEERGGRPGREGRADNDGLADRPEDELRDGDESEEALDGWRRRSAGADAYAVDLLLLLLASISASPFVMSRGDRCAIPFGLHACNESAAGLATRPSNPSFRFTQPMLLLTLSGAATSGAAPAVAVSGRSTSVQSLVMARMDVRERRARNSRRERVDRGAVMR